MTGQVFGLSFTAEAEVTRGGAVTTGDSAPNGWDDDDAPAGPPAPERDEESRR